MDLLLPRKLRDNQNNMDTGTLTLCVLIAQCRISHISQLNGALRA